MPYVDRLKLEHRKLGLRLRGWLSVGVVILSLVSLAAVCMHYQGPRLELSPEAPRLELSTNHLDLGEGKPNEVMRGVFQVRNTGSSKLRFEIQASCGCSDVKPLSGEVQPGDQAEVSLAVRLAGHSNSKRTVNVVVKSNDPEREISRCSVIARCPAPFKVSPAFVDFGQLLEEDISEAVQQIRVEALPGKPFDPTQLQARHNSESISLSKTDHSEGGLLFRVSLDRKMSPGDHYDTIELWLDGPDDVMKVPVHVRVVDPAYVIPSTVFLRTDPETGKYRPVSVLLVNRLSETRLGPVRIAEAPKGVSIQDLGNVGPTRRRLRLIVTDDITWAASATLKLTCRGMDGVVSLKLIKPSST